MPVPNGHKKIERSELPRGGVADGSRIPAVSSVTVYDLAKTFDQAHVPNFGVVATDHTGKKGDFGGSTFNTHSTGTDNPKELFNNGKGKNGDKYDD